MPRFKISSMFLRRLVVAFLMVCTLSSCGSAPWVDRRREAGKPNVFIGSSTLDRVAICHRRKEAEQVLRELAQGECAKTGRVPAYEGRTLGECPLLTPYRSVFQCR